MKKTRIRNLYLLLITALIFASCNSPLHRAYDPATYEDDMQAIRKSNKVSEEDLKSMETYIMLEKLAGNDISGRSYEDLLEKIKAFRQNNNTDNSRQSMEKESRRIRMSPFLAVSLINKSFTNTNNNPQIIFTISFKNTGGLKIKTVTGNLAINDLMEKLIRNVSILLDEDISPGQTLTKTFSTGYNDGDENDRSLRVKDFFDIRSVWDPGKIIFENGRLVE